VPYSLKSLFDNKITAINDETYKMDSFDLLKNLLPLKEPIKDKLSLFSYYYRGSLRKKISSKYIVLPVSKYIRLRNIPLSKLVLQHKHNTNLKNLKDFLVSLNKAIDPDKKVKTVWLGYYRDFLRKLFKVINLSKLYSKIVYFKDKVNHFYFFKRIFKYKVYKKKIKYKNKIPTYIWVESI
jgi:hypothetical protein